jgi:hypothetical protein
MINLNFSPSNLTTERLVLRRVTGDVNEMFLLRSNVDIMKYIPASYH